MAAVGRGNGMRGVWAGIAALALALGLALWWVGSGDAPADATAPGRSEPGAGAPAQAPPPAGDAEEAGIAPSVPHIPESGRLAIRREDLPRDGPFVLSLGLAEEAVAGQPRPVRIAAVDGRTLDATASPAGGGGGGVRLEIDPQWLRPGRYMIEVRTAEKTHLPLRRYVLEVR